MVLTRTTGFRSPSQANAAFEFVPVILLVIGVRFTTVIYFNIEYLLQVNGRK